MNNSRKLPDDASSLMGIPPSHASGPELAPRKESDIDGPASHGTLGRKQQARIAGLIACPCWTDWYLSAVNLKPARNGSSSSLARRWLEAGWLNCSVMQVQFADIGDRPLASSVNRCEFNSDSIAYFLEQRFASAARSVRVYWPSREFAKRYGSWAGADEYPCPHKVSHDLLVAAVWLRYLKTSPHIALNQWVPERRLQLEQRREDRSGPIPDALIIGGERPKAIEIGGNYSAKWLRHHVERFEAAGWDWEIW